MAESAEPTPHHVDVLIVGAGLSGIGAAYRLQEQSPGTTYAVLEGRDASGGTWDLFRYPGIRSDSDMYTLGYPFRPWTGEKAIADGADILAYLRETAAEAGIDRHIRYRHKVVAASWSTEDARWTVDVVVGDDEVPTRYTTSFLFMCSGYYRYERASRPTSRASTTSRARWSTRRTGPRTSTTRARRSSSSAPARPP
jgi:monooxygenase